MSASTLAHSEHRVHARLTSPLFGSLVQAVELMGSVLQAEIRTGRIFNVPGELPPSYVSVAGLTIPSVVQNALQDWPNCRDSAFEIVHQHVKGEAVFRPCEFMNDSLEHRQLAYLPLCNLCQVVDSLGISLELGHNMRCIMIFLRCDRATPFRETDFQSIRQLKPKIHAVLGRGVQQQFDYTTTDHWPQAFLPQQMATPFQRLASLSETERRVLAHLQTRVTERQIAEKLERSPHTVHVHVKSIYRKLAVSSRKELIALMDRLRN